jgi:uncharacterized membrane protein
MKNISFDNPYLLLLAIPVILAILIPYFIVKNKDNKSSTWLISAITHVVITVLVVLAISGLSKTTLLTETSIYVVADVSHSSERNLDKIDEYIEEISESLPEKTKLGVVCFGKDCIITTPLGRKIVSVKDSGVDDSATNIAKALTFTESLFTGDSLKRIILITDGNDTVNESVGTIASTVERITENGIQIDAIFLDNTLADDDKEVQLLETEQASTSYIGKQSETKLLIQSSTNTQALLELYAREKGSDVEFEKVSQSVVLLDKGLTTVKVPLKTDESKAYEYKVVVTAQDDTSSVNNARYFTQTVVGEEKILLITGNQNDISVVRSIYGQKAEIDTYIVVSSGSRVPFMLEELVEYDEIILSNIDIRNIRNVNAFVDSVDMVVSQYGKSLITLGDLKLQTNSDDPIFKKLSELLPVTYGSTRIDGRLYTIVMDVSHSMYMASKFTIAKQSAIQLISVLDPEDYVCFVEFSGDVKLQTPKKVKDCKDALIKYINSLEPSHGTDIGLGLEEALKTINALRLTENQVMVISDGFSFRSEHDAEAITKELYSQGTLVSTICTYIMSEGTNGRTTMNKLASLGGTDKAYIISRPEDVAGVVFGQVADEIGAVIVEKLANVNIAKYKDPIVNGMDAVPNVSGFIISLEKYDATVPLTITYQKDNGYQETVPLYAYRAHGNGRVASLTTSLTGPWTQKWSGSDKELFLTNLFVSNIPKERVDYPFTVNVERTDFDATIEIVPTVLNPAAVTKLEIKAPNGRVTKRTLSFDKQKYYYSFTLNQIGSYTIDITYIYDESEFKTSTSFNIPYTKEYNEFATFDKFNVYAFMRGKGEILVDEIPSLENDQSKITTYKQSYAIPLLLSAAALFVIDVFVRKLRVKRKGVKR